MINVDRSHRKLFISLLATLSIHIILLFFSSQIFLLNRENDAEFSDSEKMVIEFKIIGQEDSRVKDKVFARGGSKVKSPESQPRKVKTFKFQGNKTFKSTLPESLQRTSFGESDSTFSLEIPEGVPEEELNEFQRILYSFYVRLQGQYVSTLVDKIMESQRLNPKYRIPISRERDRIILRATYDFNGNIVRIKTLQAARIKEHSEFFHEAIRNIETIPNPPEMLLDKRKQFHVNYDLKLNPRFY